MRTFSEIPSDPGLPGLGNLRDIRHAGELHAYLLDLHQRRGDTVRFRLGTQEAVSTTSPEALSRLANSGFDQRPDLMRPFMGWLGDGNIAFKSGKESRRTRAQLIPLLTGQALASVCEEGTRHSDEVLGRVPEGEPFDALGCFHEVTLRTMGACCFGEDFAQGPGAEIGERFMRVLRENPLDIGSFLPPVWRPSYWRWRGEVRTLHERVSELIARRRSVDARSSGDLLGLLLRERDEEGTPLFSDEEARMAVLAFYFGGVDATAAATLWTSMLLAQNPGTQEEVQKELDRVLGPRAPRADDLDELPLLSAVVQESLRIFPPNPLNMRRIERPREVDGYEVPEGTVFFVTIIGIHHSPRLWDEPLAFRPARFLGGADKSRHRYAHIPFGVGAKSCIGARFATTEVRLLLCRLLQRFTIRASREVRLETRLRSGVLFPAVEPSLTLKPR